MKYNYAKSKPDVGVTVGALEGTKKESGKEVINKQLCK